MKDLRKWMVGLDLTDHDEKLIRYTYELSGSFDPEEIVFVHVKKRNPIPERFRSHPDHSREELLKIIEDKVHKVFDETKKVKCEVHGGTPYFDLWRETFLHQTDLFIIGEKNDVKSRKLVPEKFVRKSFCSVLFVPEKTRKIKKIWIPVDFSENSRDAVDVGLQIKEHFPEVDIVCQYVFETPSIDLIEAEVRKDYVDYFRDESREKFGKFAGSIADVSSIELHLTPWLYADVADHIKEGAEGNEADIIIMSSGGKSRISSLFLGSSTSELIKLEKKIPLLILKQKINKIHAWDILTNL